MPRRKFTAGEREVAFWAKVKKTDLCWLWQGSKDREGYGRFKYGHPRREQLAHRVAYILKVGPIPEGMQIDHLCRNPPCVNPDHLEPVTSRENTARSVFATRPLCKHGHPMDAIDHRGYRCCSTCVRESIQRGMATRRARKREARGV